MKLSRLIDSSLSRCLPPYLLVPVIVVVLNHSMLIHILLVAKFKYYSHDYQLNIHKKLFGKPLSTRLFMKLKDPAR